MSFTRERKEKPLVNGNKSSKTWGVLPLVRGYNPHTLKLNYGLDTTVSDSFR